MMFSGGGAEMYASPVTIVNSTGGVVWKSAPVMKSFVKNVPIIQDFGFSAITINKPVVFTNEQVILKHDCGLVVVEGVFRGDGNYANIIIDRL